MIKNKRLFVILSVVILALSLIFTINFKSFLSVFEDSTTRVILIDPGHGGIDGGACSSDGVCEKNINLSISLKLDELLKKDGYKVVLTRYEDSGLYTEGKSVRDKKIEDLNKRAAMKKDTECDLFVSIHLNKFPQADCKGAQVWYSRHEDSMNFANLVQENLIIDLDPSNKRKAKPAETHYKVLRSNDTMPGIIVECGFLSNNEEAKKLSTDEYQTKIAESLYKSISMYFKNGEN